MMLSPSELVRLVSFPVHTQNENYSFHLYFFSTGQDYDTFQALTTHTHVKNNYILPIAP